MRIVVNCVIVATAIILDKNFVAGILTNASQEAVEHHIVECEKKGLNSCRTRSNETVEDNGSLVQVNTTFSNTMSQENGTLDNFEAA